MQITELKLRADFFFFFQSRWIKDAVRQEYHNLENQSVFTFCMSDNHLFCWLIVGFLHFYDVLLKITFPA